MSPEPVICSDCGSTCRPFDNRCSTCGSPLKKVSAEVVSQQSSINTSSQDPQTSTLSFEQVIHSEIPSSNYCVNKPLTPVMFRMPNEYATLALGIAITSILIIFFTSITVGIFLLIAIIIVLMYYWQVCKYFVSNVRITEKQFPELYSYAVLAASNLDMPLPPVFISYSPQINANAAGFFGKFGVVINSATLESLSPAELIFIIGHEFAHIKCGHTTWLTITQPLQNASGGVNIPIVSNLLGYIFSPWAVTSEYTADRGGLIASGDLGAAIHVMAIFAVGPEYAKKIDFEQFHQQTDKLTKNAIVMISEYMGDHPYNVNRAKALLKFFNSKEYQTLIERA